MRKEDHGPDVSREPENIRASGADPVSPDLKKYLVNISRSSEISPE
jgi:hypothetical protein